MMRVLYYHNGKMSYQLAPAAIPETLRKKRGLIWLDIEGQDDKDYRFLEDQLKFHHLAVEDCRDVGMRPKMEDYGNFLFFVFRGINYSSGTHALDTLGLKVFVAEGIIVTVHHKRSRTIEEIYCRLERQPQLMESDELLFYTILDTLTDNIMPIIAHVEQRLELFQHHIFKKFSTAILEEIFELKTWVLRLRHFLIPQLEIIQRLIKLEHPLFQEDLHYYLRDVRDHTLQVLEHLEIFEQLFPDAMNSYLTQVTNRMNEVMKTMSIIATLMLPLTFITGIFGMNFQHMPLIYQESWAFWTIMAGMSVVFGAMVYYFRKKDWF